MNRPSAVRPLLHGAMLAALLLVGQPAFAAENGLVTRPSRFGVDETVEKIATTAKTRGLTVFATIDHAAGARQVGLAMRPTVVMVIGNPKGGTPVMIAAPSSAIDLPLKVLVAEDPSGATVVTINDPAHVQQRHRVPAELLPALSGLSPLLDAALQ